MTFQAQFVLAMFVVDGLYYRRVQLHSGKQVIQLYSISHCFRRATQGFAFISPDTSIELEFSQTILLFMLNNYNRCDCYLIAYIGERPSLNTLYTIIIHIQHVPHCAESSIERMRTVKNFCSSKRNAKYYFALRFEGRSSAVQYYFFGLLCRTMQYKRSG